MDYINNFISLFSVEDVKQAERVKNFNLNFKVQKGLCPTYDVLLACLKKFPTRDKVTVFLKDETDDILEFFLEKSYETQSEYERFLSMISENDFVFVELKISKNIEENRFSIYNSDSFFSDLVSLSIEDIIKTFSYLLKEQEQLFFEIYDTTIYFKTRTMTFSSDKNNFVLKPFERKARLEDCKNTTYFYNFSTFTVLPDDFEIEVDSPVNPLSSTFKQLSTIFSLVYIADNSTLENQKLNFHISGYKNLSNSYPIHNITTNPILFQIYDWIYTGGNIIDKAILARSIITLHCKFKKTYELDEIVLLSIRSNFKLYLKDNIANYLKLKSELSEFITEVLSKTGEYSIQLLKGFKTNIIAILGFLFTVVVANIASNKPLDNIFTADIVNILKFVIIGSLFYWLISLSEIIFLKKKIKETYIALKKNYLDLLLEKEIEKIFKNDELINKTLKTLNFWLAFYSILWLLVLTLFWCFLHSSYNIQL